MAVMHHEILRVNAPAPDSDELMEIWAERGWLPGPHPETDLDDPAPDIKRVKPLTTPKTKD